MLALGGCSSEGVAPPEIDSVDPKTVVFGTERAAVVHGRNFYAKARCDLGGDPPVVDRRFVVILGDHRLPSESVAFINTQRIQILIPSSLELGMHPLTVIRPGGGQAVRDDAVEVVEVIVDCTLDADGDGHLHTSCSGGDDCNDSDAAVYPGASDSICDGVDNDCNGVVDDAFSGPPAELLESTCDDGLDNDCDGTADADDSDCVETCVDLDKDGYGNPGFAGCPSGDALDCDDHDDTRNPGAPDDNCDDVDQNCDGTADEAYVRTTTECGAFSCASTGELSCVGGKELDSCVELEPAEPHEISCDDNVDNDCDGQTDSLDPDCMPCVDGDSDGYGDPGSVFCGNGPELDCDDGSENVNPGALDNNCDGVDDNCSGGADENYVKSQTTCGIGVCAFVGEFNCIAGAPTNSCAPLPPTESPEVTCDDGLDNDCDGLADLGDSNCDWWDVGWARRRPIFFDNGAQGEDLDAFPVLVKLDSSRINTSIMQPSGADLRFVDADDSTILAHEVESWDPGGTSYVWVKAPRIDGGSKLDFIWMYYGNTTAPDAQSPAAVWSADYRAVYHLHGDLLDSSSSGYHATNHGTTDVQGYIGGARYFDGSDIIDLGSNLDILRQVPGATLSAWMNATTAGSGRGWLISISKNNGSIPTDLSRAQVGAVDFSEIIAGGRSNDAESWQMLTTHSNPVDANAWYWVTAVLDYGGDTVTVYVDGQREESGAVNFAQDITPDTSSTGSYLGVEADGDHSRFRGIIDEPRVAGVARSADWIAAQYLSMTDAFCTFGPEEAF